VYKHQKNENPTKTYEDKVLKNKPSEKDSALNTSSKIVKSLAGI